MSHEFTLKMYIHMYIKMYIHMYHECTNIQPVPWKMRLRMVKEMQIEILNGGEILVN